MADKFANCSVLGNDWFQSFSKFRLNRESFLDEIKLTRDAFCLDVLKDLYKDHIDVQCKNCLLLLLQEHSVYLIRDINLLVHVVGSLTNLFCVLGKGSEKRLLKSPIIMAITSILLAWTSEDDISKPILNSKAFFLKVIYDTTEDFVVISTACKCLEEIEIFYPGILKSEVKDIIAACEGHTSPAFQSYSLLICTIIRNMICSKNLSDKKILQDSDVNSEEDCGEEIHIFSVVSYLLDLLPMMTYTAAYKVLKDLICIVKNSSELLSTTFKLFLPRLFMSSEVPLLHLSFDLLQTFGMDLFSVQEEKFLLKQVGILSIHPCLTSSHKLLYLDWVKDCVAKQNIFSFSFPRSLTEVLLPGPFDGPVTQEKKSCILSLLIPPSADTSLAVEFLNESVSGLRKCALLPGGTKAASSFFRALFAYFSCHKNEVMCDFIYKSLTNIMKTSPHLTPYALSFLKAVKVECSERNFQNKIVAHIVEHILSMPMKQLKCNIEHYLVFLEFAAQESGSICKPRAVLRLLQIFLMKVDFETENAWCLGNDILSVCRAFLKFHDVQIFYYDLAEVLCSVALKFDDADVKDRAKIYYSLLTCLSRLKVQTIFNLQASERDTKNPFISFVTGVDSNFQSASSIQKLAKPVLLLKRVKQNNGNSLNDVMARSASVPIANVFEIYQQHLKTHHHAVSVPFALAYANDIDKPFCNMYSIVITAQSTPLCKEISGIEIPVLKEDKEQETLINLRFIPLEPHPLTLYLRAEFTCSNGYTYSCHLQPVILKFEDAFLPLPVPEHLDCSVSLWRQNLFNELWDRFLEESKSTHLEEVRYCQSAFCFDVKKEDLPKIVEEQWKPFIIEKLPNMLYAIAIFLPPKNHLLMKISIVNEKPFINILVDSILILPWANLYLQEIIDATRT